MIEVIVTSRGAGTGVEGDPARRVIELYTRDGEFICEADPVTSPSVLVSPVNNAAMQALFDGDGK